MADFIEAANRAMAFCTRTCDRENPLQTLDACHRVFKETIELAEEPLRIEPRSLDRQNCNTLLVTYRKIDEFITFMLRLPGYTTLYHWSNDYRQHFQTDARRTAIQRRLADLNNM